ncbi:LPS export ABC transporter ATP-binding protein [Candidatus Marinimicrobia bacterium MT.SAG.2]|nr:LPS export ABC transporter ATP-binding protein [Candidatus Marinimicrobia bacterium MT.SAG.2]
MSKFTFSKTLGVQGLRKRYGKKVVVNGISLDVHKGEIVGLLGPNGAGKTTTFYMITGMIRPNGGQVYLEKQNITSMPMYKRARLGIGYLSQEPSVFRRLTVEDNLKLILQTMNLSRKEVSFRIDKYLNDMSITHIRKRKGYQLSGGERRRTEICRALLTEPDFMLLDEPFSGIDPIAVEEIQNIVIDLKRRGIGVLITDHNVHETLSITDRAYLLFEGKIFIEGTSEYLANDPDARKLYFGDKFRLDRY